MGDVDILFGGPGLWQEGQRRRVLRSCIWCAIEVAAFYLLFGLRDSYRHRASDPEPKTIEKTGYVGGRGCGCVGVVGV